MSFQRHRFTYIGPVLTDTGVRHQYRCPECGEERVLEQRYGVYIEPTEHLHEQVAEQDTEHDVALVGAGTVPETAVRRKRHA